MPCSVIYREVAVCNVHAHVPVDGFSFCDAATAVALATFSGTNEYSTLKIKESQNFFHSSSMNSTWMEKVSDDTYTWICSQCKRNKSHKKSNENLWKKVRLQLSISESLKKDKRNETWMQSIKMLNVFCCWVYRALNTKRCIFSHFNNNSRANIRACTTNFGRITICGKVLNLQCDV